MPGSWIHAFINAVQESYCLIKPGRRGSNNIHLGVNVTYADIDAASVMVEVAKSSGGYVPELSYGTHFFSELVETGFTTYRCFPGLRTTP